MGEEVVYLI